MSENSKTYFKSEVDRLYGEELFRPELYVQVRQSRDFMEKYHTEKIKLNDLAAAAFMSRFHYVRIFQRMYGLTPRCYLRDFRISNAKKLLKKGLPITQVCFDVGYESLPTFSAVFKKCTGYTPSEYQRIQKSNLE
ncbi:helix-turn-helix transcriptional regulator [Gilvimarinus agarilyticus]|uniref:helix-turn-helix transcriptional regulator n=1 Tax=Gilvimarinus sp. 2_MG-2023 TaxID=3062666 RepID=UPI001C094EDE|nr:helix-turn-helix transcriptional regulator [Gilvimarinus sp. 2_MG-2023]MBU2885611.1 helix-turn-helix transcriptional regulator [Gilvimarinus agarilyticus]MDO6570477.1 helix-turn-helix transcriptional regulator [Gilvimarinus sp. 2_MG-2023]